MIAVCRRSTLTFITVFTLSLVDLIRWIALAVVFDQSGHRTHLPEVTLTTDQESGLLVCSGIWQQHDMSCRD